MKIAEDEHSPNEINEMPEKPGSNQFSTVEASKSFLKP